MKVKRYLVNDLPEAVHLIRSELGADAVILNTKEIRVGGFLGMFRKRRVEVFAAVDESASRPKPRASLPGAQRRPAGAPAAAAAPPAQAAAPAAPAALTMAAAAQASAERQASADGGAVAAEAAAPAASWVPPAVARERYGRSGGEAAAAEILAALAKSTAPAPAAAAQVPVPAAAAAESQPAEGRAEPRAPQPAPLQPLRSELSALRGAPAPGEDETAMLLREIRSMKEMMQKANRQMMFSSMPSDVMLLSRQLAEQGVEPAYVQQFAEEVSERMTGRSEAGHPDASALEQGRALLKEWLQPAVGAGFSASTRIVGFVGPTGVGKTTTIAKLAADQAFVHRRSVGFITADTYRIAAVDQLRTYADILNVPLEVVFSPSELSRAYKKLEDRDLLLMDTAGRNYRNELFVSEVNSLLAPGQQSESMLVLSLTQKYADMKLVASQFAKYGVRRLLFTKLDETESVGSIVNIARDFDFEISYITCGQTVPDDIKPFDPDDVVRRLLGDASDA